MKSNPYESLNDEDLVNRRNQMKSGVVVLFAVFVMMIVISIIAFFTTDTMSIVVYFPAFFLPIVYVFYSMYTRLHSEVIKRNL